MADDLQRLIVSLEARIASFEKNMAKAEAQSDKRLGKIETRFKNANKSIGAGLAKLGSLAAVALPAGGLLGLSSAVSAAADSVARIGDEAQRAGVSIKAIQELSYVASQNRISIDAMVDGLKELNLRADEFVITGKGPAAEAFQRLGFSAAELTQALKDPSGLMVEIIGRMQDLETAAQIRIADELFGGSAGERFVELLDLGADGLRDMIREANDLGIVLEDEAVKKAQEINREFAKLADTVSARVKGAIVEASSELSYFLRLLKDVGDRSDATLRQQISEKDAAIEGARGKTLFGFSSDTYIANLEADRDKLVKELARRAVARGGGAVPTRDEWLRKSSAGSYRGGEDVPDPKRTGKAKVNDYEKAVARAREYTQTLREEAELMARIGPFVDDYGYALAQAAQARELVTAAERAGIAITPTIRAQIDELAASYAAVTAEAARVAEGNAEALKRSEEFSGGARDALKGYVSDLAKGANAADAFASAMARLGDRLLDSGLDRAFDLLSGGLSGGLSGARRSRGLLGGAIIPGILHGGGLAGGAGYGHGRSLPAGVWSGAPRYHGGGVAGLKPDEVPAVLLRGERVSRRGDTAGGGLVVPVTQHFTISGTVSDRDVQEMVAQGQAGTVAAVKAAFPGMVARYQADGDLG